MVKPLDCEGAAKAVSMEDPLVRVIAARRYAKGDQLPPSAREGVTNASADLCMIKLIVGPGNPGPRDAPSTSDGIGIEIWLPAEATWARRLHFLGGGGFAGDPDIKAANRVNALAAWIAGTEGAVTAVTDTGHEAHDETSPQGDHNLNGAFAWKPDGTFNAALWRDFAVRGIHEMVVRTKALAVAHYGTKNFKAYWDGCSTGGRQGLKLVQAYPDDLDAVVVGAPAINWTRFITSELYPQTVMLRDLPEPISKAKLDAVSAAAVSACDSSVTGKHDGFISDPDHCRYDPTRDRAVLCPSDGGTGAAGTCLSQLEALAVNKFWYGQTADGSAPRPEVDNGSATTLKRGRLWYGIPRDAVLALAGSKDGRPDAFSISTAIVSYNLGDPLLMDPSPAIGASWTKLGYADLRRAQENGVAKQKLFDGINTDDPNIAAYRARGGKILMYHGLADTVITYQGSRRYYRDVSRALGGTKSVRSFFRYYEIPGMAHCGGTNANGLAGISPPANAPTPAPGQMYQQLVRWVEDGQVPEQIELSTADKRDHRPICPFPERIVYLDKGSHDGGNYICRVGK